MKRKTETIHDPDLGPIEIPLEKPLTPRQANLMRQRIRAALLRQRRFEERKVYPCMECGKNDVRAASDLSATLSMGRKLALFRNLKGGRCGSCGAEHLEASEQIHIEEEADRLVGPTEDVGVSRVGRGTLGTYWPKPVERRLGLRAGDRMEVQILGPSTALLTVRRTKKKAKAA